MERQNRRDLEGSLEGFDVVIHLAGAGIGDKRWSKKRKNLIAQSRVVPTENLSKALAALDAPPSLFMCASAVGFYDNRGDEELDESSSIGEGFSNDLQAVGGFNQGCTEVDSYHPHANWNRNDCCRRNAQANFTHRQDGCSQSIGGGRQWQSWISLDDQIYAIHFLMNQEAAHGIYNLTAPQPVTQKQFARTLGKVLRRPAFAPAPGFVMKILFGEMGKSLILDGQKVHPKRLLDSGYKFELRIFSNQLLLRCSWPVQLIVAFFLNRHVLWTNMLGRSIAVGMFALMLLSMVPSVHADDTQAGSNLLTDGVSSNGYVCDPDGCSPNDGTDCGEYTHTKVTLSASHFQDR